MSEFERRFMREPRRSPKPAPPQCGQVAEGDEYVCRGCFMRWARDEDRPACPKGNDNGL